VIKQQALVTIVKNLVRVLLCAKKVRVDLVNQEELCDD